MLLPCPSIIIAILVHSAISQELSHSVNNNSAIVISHQSQYYRNYSASVLCPDYCNALNCNIQNCKKCEFICGSEGITCRSPYTNHGQKKCKLTKFVDVTKKKFFVDYWNDYPTAGRPRRPENGPLFVDVNGDGILDFFDFSHQAQKEVVESVFASPSDNISTLIPAKDRIHIEGLNPDSHGHNVLDLDGDNILDILVAVGGGKGGRNTNKPPSHTNNLLLWGELQGNTTIFRGGQYEAKKAGINMLLRRGRINYMLDINNDGLMDIFFGVDRRTSNEIKPGILYINQGDRTWKEDLTLTEYSKAMIVSDVDGDGYANEFVINRDFCFPERKGPDTDEKFPDLGPYLDDVIEFCSTRPVGTTAVYKYNMNKGQVENIGKQYQNVSENNTMQPPCCPHGIGAFATDHDCFVLSIASIDIDGDLLADHIFLYSSKMKFYISSDRPKGVLPFGNQYVSHTVYFPDYCLAKAIRVFDFDNSCQESILIMCEEPATFLLYTRKRAGNRLWVLMDCNDNTTKGTLGDLNKKDLAGITKDDFTAACASEKSKRKGFVKDLCDYYTGTSNKKPDLKARGISVVDLNNDGFLDLVVAHNFGHLIFFHNRPFRKSKKNQYIVLKLKGSGFNAGNNITGTNVYGIGATVILYANMICKKKKCLDGDDSLKDVTTQFREMSSHQHFSDKFGYKDDRIIFGLGPIGQPIKVVVRWPSGWEQTESLANWTFSKELQVVEIKEAT